MDDLKYRMSSAELKEAMLARSVGYPPRSVAYPPQRRLSVGYQPHVLDMAEKMDRHQAGRVYDQVWRETDNAQPAPPTYLEPTYDSLKADIADLRAQLSVARAALGEAKKTAKRRLHMLIEQSRREAAVNELADAVERLMPRIKRPIE